MGITQRDMLEAAQRHLARFPTTRKHLERVLKRRLYRARRRGEEVPDEAQEWIRSALDNMERVGLLDDALFAKLRVSSLRGAGTSARVIRGKLVAQGVLPEEVDGLLAQEDRGRELHAARRYLQRRRLGPYASSDRADPKKALSALARAGYSYHVAQQALVLDEDSTTEEEHPVL